MSNREDDPSNDQPVVVVGGRVDALQGLIEPPPLSDAQKNIIRWYNQLADQLAGPRSGDGRGPAQRPAWILEAPTIDRIAMEVEREILIEGSGFRALTDVRVDGELPDSWQVVTDGELMIEVSDGAAREMLIELRSPGGIVDAVLPIPADDAGE
jgi:hypothetical protein